MSSLQLFWMNIERVDMDTAVRSTGGVKQLKQTIQKSSAYELTPLSLNEFGSRHFCK